LDGEEERIFAKMEDSEGLHFQDEPSQLAALAGGEAAISWRLCGVLGLWFLTVVVATEGWYRLHEGKPCVTWTFRWPREMTGYQQTPVSPVVSDMLQFDSGGEAVWQAPDGTGRCAFFFKWMPGVSRTRLPSRAHRPEICLAANGYSLQGDLGMQSLNVGGVDIPFKHYVFEKDGVPVNVFFCVWQDHPRAETIQIARDWNRYSGLLFALHGQRRISMQELEFAMYGPLPPDQALEKFRSEMKGLIVM
jgi:hypothetical protein